MDSSLSNIPDRITAKFQSANSWCSTHNLCCVVCTVIIVIALLWVIKKIFKYLCNCKEEFETISQNFVYGNPYGEANNLEYGNSEAQPISEPNSVSGPSSNYGVGMVDNTNIFDDRGYKWTRNPKSANVDSVMSQMSNDAMRNSFQNMYMLDPSNSVSSFDAANMPVSKNCCPAQYAPPFDVGGNNCDFANKYVANNLMGDNSNSNGAGCICMKPEQANFFSKRGGNS